MKRRRMKNKSKILVILALLICIGGAGYVANYLITTEIVHKEGIRKEIDSLYQDAEHFRFAVNVSEDHIISIKNSIRTLEKGKEKLAFMKEIEEAQNLFETFESVQSLLKNNIIVDDVTKDDIENMQTNVSLAGQIRSGFLTTISADTLNIMQQFYDIEEAKKKVAALFQEDGGGVRFDVGIDEYESAKNYIVPIRNKKAIKELNEKIEIVLVHIEERDALKQPQTSGDKKAINDAYHILDVPYINQTASGALQGCEAASLLMALRYKGAAYDIEYLDFMAGMPTSDNANFGFVHSQFDNEPTGVPHTIFPSPLADYGSNYGTVVDISGATPAQLREEIVNGNPVIVYIVSGFKEPKWVDTSYGKDILNIHVLTLIGYNDLLQKYLVNDPYYGVIWVDYDEFEYSYEIRSFAVVVR